MKTSLPLLLCVLASSAQAFELVSDAELGAELEARAAPGAKALMDEPPTRGLETGWPRIKVVEPSSSTVVPPVRIAVRFEGESEATPVNPDSFRAYYGMLGIDITDRIRKATPVTDKGFLAEGAELPPGTHAIRLEVRDRNGRKADLKLKVKVEEAPGK